MTVTDLHPAGSEADRTLTADGYAVGRTRRPFGNSGHNYVVLGYRPVSTQRFRHSVRLYVNTGARQLDSLSTSFRPEDAAALGAELVEYAALAAHLDGGLPAREHYRAENGRGYAVELLPGARDTGPPRRRRVRLAVRRWAGRGDLLTTVTDVFRAEDARAIGAALIINAGRATCDCPEEQL